MVRKLLIVSLVAAAAGSANATVLNFDDVVTFNGAVSMPAGYGGLNWQADSWGVVSQQYYTGYGNTIPFPTEANVAFNSYGKMTVAVDNGLFDFSGAYVATWASNNGFGTYSSTTLKIEGFNGASLVGSKTVQLGTDFSWFDAGFVGVDRLEFSSDGTERWWLLDNFTYKEMGQASVPGPAAAIPFVAGLLALRRRRN